MQVTGSWLLVGPKIKRDKRATKDNETTDRKAKLPAMMDAKVLAVIKRTKPLKDPVLFSDPEAAELIEEMTNVAAEIFLITEFKRYDDYTAIQKEIAKRWQTTLLARAIACGLGKTAAYLYENQEHLFIQLTLADVVEVLLHCFPQDQKNPVNAVLEIFRSRRVKLEIALRLFADTKEYLFGQSLTLQARKAIEDGMKKQETGDDEDDGNLRPGQTAT